MATRFTRIAFTVTLLASLAPLARAQVQVQTDPLQDAGGTSGAGDRFAVHGQATLVEQVTAPFHTPYSGTNSLSSRHGAETFDATLFLGARLWQGAEAWFNPEIDQGFGLDNTLGVAGFPSGEAYKVGRSHPYWRVPRLFLRQTGNLGGDDEPVEAGANQFASVRSANRWVITIGKFGVTDIFDVNPYAHDPRGDFLNWAAIDAATFDYAADAWGYTVGAATEWYHGAWTLRAGAFDLSNIPNSETLDHGFHQFQWVGELERRHEFKEQAGKLLLTVFDSRGRMARLDDAVALAGATDQDINSALINSRRYQDRAGISVDLEQQLSPDLGVFLRAGGAGGHVEAYEFTDVDRTLAGGFSLHGAPWHRAGDTVGFAAIINRISAARTRFLNAGGLGILVGDGQLPHPGPEQILETWYQLTPVPWAGLTLDCQHIIDPAYNRDRGPVSVVAVRLHAQF